MENAEPCICCRRAVLFMLCFLLSEGQSHETNALYRTAKQCQHWWQHWSLSCCSCRLLTNFRQYSISQALGRVMQPHPSDPTWSQWASGWAYPAWSSTASVMPDLSWFGQSPWCSGTAWPSSPVKRNAMRLWSDLQAASPAGLDGCSSVGVTRTALTRCSSRSGESSRMGAPQPALVCNEGCRQWRWYMRHCHPQVI